MSARDAVLGEVWRSRELIKDFDLLVGCGGRLAGSGSEAAALGILRDRLGGIPGARLGEHAFDYDGWANQTSRLELLSPPPAVFPCHALVWSGETPGEGIEADVLDLGRGAPGDFEAAGDRTRGRLVMVRHEYPFATNAIHRRLKYTGGARRRRRRISHRQRTARRIAGHRVLRPGHAREHPRRRGQSRDVGGAVAGRGGRSSPGASDRHQRTPSGDGRQPDRRGSRRHA